LRALLLALKALKALRAPLLALRALPAGHRDLWVRLLRRMALPA
jgi:hypothetical protein